MIGRYIYTDMKKKEFFSFLMVCGYGIGVFGGIFSAMMEGAWVFAVGVAILAWMAWPQLVHFYKNLL